MKKWLDSYIVFARKTMTRNYADNVEKVVAHFAAAAVADRKPLSGQISAKWILKYLTEIAEYSGIEGGLLALRVMKKAWKWGARHIERFPCSPSPFEKVRSLPIKRPKKSTLSIEQI